MHPIYKAKYSSLPSGIPLFVSIIEMSFVRLKDFVKQYNDIRKRFSADRMGNNTKTFPDFPLCVFTPTYRTAN